MEPPLESFAWPGEEPVQLKAHPNMPRHLDGNPYFWHHSDGKRKVLRYEAYLLDPDSSLNEILLVVHYEVPDKVLVVRYTGRSKYFKREDNGNYANGSEESITEALWLHWKRVNNRN